MDNDITVVKSNSRKLSGTLDPQETVEMRMKSLQEEIEMYKKANKELIENQTKLQDGNNYLRNEIRLMKENEELNKLKFRNLELSFHDMLFQLKARTLKERQRMTTSNESLMKVMNYEVLRASIDMSSSSAITSMVQMLQEFSINEKPDQKVKTDMVVKEIKAFSSYINKNRGVYSTRAAIKKNRNKQGSHNEKSSPQKKSIAITPTEDPVAQLPKSEHRGERLNKTDWEKYKNEKGQITDKNEVRRRVFLGGLEPDMRKEVWKYLLNYFPWDSTNEELEKLREEKVKEYNVLKSQWQSISKKQESNFEQYVLRKDQIERDVVRTDRTSSEFESDDSPKLKILNNVLLTYTFYNWNIAYTQGMNDLLVPILLVMEDEVDTFWCFAGLLDQIGKNFAGNQQGIHSHLFILSKLVKFLDPWLHTFFTKSESLHMLFCFRWFLLYFKREFEMEKVMLLWDSLWTFYLNDRFIIFFALSVILQHRDKIIEENMTFDDLLKFCNSLSMTIDFDYTFNLAVTLFQKYDETSSQEVKNKIFDCKMIESLTGDTDQDDPYF
eukprot:TRINITY_DN2682_c0_g2_i1.p1 TRINITY_DN2682_c0_g2~~TRINITY_DN2682_c0_g2_i1.p1  ORF type:complete len:553 (-),score=66.76 TRINITY_DN2682_c0_g2_i1:17-1675(-)